MSLGDRAAVNGKNFERLVRALMDACGIDYIRDAPYPSVYRHGARMEFCARNLILRGKTYGRANIECKYQESGGSVDEKFPYVVLNALVSDADTTVVVLGGHAFKKGAIDWLCTMEDASNGRLHVLGLADLEEDLDNGYGGALTAAYQRVGVAPPWLIAGASGRMSNGYKKSTLNKYTKPDWKSYKQAMDARAAALGRHIFSIPRFPASLPGKDRATDKKQGRE